ncbi:hypothetical protein AUG19_06645 [archaeon 13_1_20CM_2_54_9]|nr:MAG: hypothetical protein AUG19_06645 [archaeon 13_1_20CM_2_54_9]
MATKRDLRLRQILGLKVSLEPGRVIFLGTLLTMGCRSHPSIPSCIHPVVSDTLHQTQRLVDGIPRGCLRVLERPAAGRGNAF